jgi:hypothetical protein
MKTTSYVLQGPKMGLATDNVLKNNEKWFRVARKNGFLGAW